MKIFKDIWRFILKDYKGQFIPVFLILIIAGVFYFQNLGNNYITLWDEVVHINVVKNLSQDPWPPRLHLTDIGSDFQDWTNNYIWVHKPLLPLYIQALFYKLSPTLWAFRLPGVIFAFGMVILLFIVTKRHFDVVSAWVVSSLLAFNPYTLALVTGRQFSGLHDLMFGFFGILTLNQILTIANIPVKATAFLTWRQNWRWQSMLFGVFAGLAYLSKGGLAFLFFIPWLSVVFSGIVGGLNRKSITEGFFYTVYSGMWTCMIIFSEKIYLLLTYPAEYFFEQSLQFLHLFKYLEYWGRPWDYYMSVYLRDMLTPPAYWAVIAGLGFALSVWYSNPKVKILAVWVLAFLIPLSAGMTKISNFIFVILPVLYILLTQFVSWQILTKKFELIFSFAGLSFFTYVCIRLDVAKIKLHFFQDFALIQRLAIFSFSILGFSLLYSLVKFFNHKMLLARFAKLAVWSSFALLAGTYLRAMQIHNQAYRNFPDFQTQTELRVSALAIRNQIPDNAIVLIDFPLLPKSHLYFQYFSGRDAMEIYNRQPLFLLTKQMPQNRPLYVLSAQALNNQHLELIGMTPNFFYKIK